MTIRLRLTLWYTALLGATLILFSGIVYAALAQNLRSQFLEETRRQATEVSKAVTQQFEGNLVIFRSDDLNNVLPPPQVNVVDIFAGRDPIQVIRGDGKILMQSDQLARTRLIVPNYKTALEDVGHGYNHFYYFQFDTKDENALAIVYSVPFLVGREVGGAVQIIRSARQVEGALQQINRYLVVGTAFSLVLAAIIGAFLARRALVPIDTITRTASSITRTQDLEQRLNIHDSVSEVGQLAATFNEMLDRIQQLFRTQERLVADVSHELRTPLTTVQGNIELLQRMAGLKTQEQMHAAFTETLQETLREVENETTRMGHMITDLLLLAQADSGALKLQFAQVEMDTLLLEVYRQTRRIADRRKNTVGWDIRLGSEDQALVWGDRERLRQLLLNLADNALKYTPEGGTITLSLENRQGWVGIAVSDTGIGIPPNQQEAVFERFYRTDKARSRELGGSGLGLSIVQWIAQAHQGRITLQSTPQIGSSFTLWLPELQARPPAAETPLGEGALAPPVRNAYPALSAEPN
jgi:heavy metal sensor kinase